jgi:hypothetical protein
MSLLFTPLVQLLLIADNHGTISQQEAEATKTKATKKTT